DWQTQYFATWRFVVQRFRDDSGVAGYDIINEPHSFPLPPLRFDKDQLFPFYRNAIQQLGDADPNHLFFLDNDMAGDLPTWVVPLHGPNIVYAPHVYTGSLIPPGFNGDGSSLAAHVAELAREAAQVPAALWFGEFSIDIHKPHAVDWVNDMIADFAARDAGWAWWQWRESSGYGVRSADGSTLDMATLHLLARPYLQAAPSGVSSDVGDGEHGELRITITAAHGDAPIVVAWPAYTLGTPQISAGCAPASQWDVAAARLTLNVPRASACVVQLRAG
ncbi:MAG TPA: cellulase family glycosylhydrolase, partial [Dehalococcoidia bacterium]|nr:cellulase family glycosylhydrolase [Dehalococcoidia bacterium]